MNRKKELKQMYKEMETQAGVYQIKNTKNGKILVGSSTNLKTLNGILFRLENGLYSNPLQEEWNRYGKEAFTFEVLEVLKKKKDPWFDEKRELEKLEQKWLNQLKPYGERGYNKKKE